MSRATALGVVLMWGAECAIETLPARSLGNLINFELGLIGLPDRKPVAGHLKRPVFLFLGTLHSDNYHCKILAFSLVPESVPDQ